MCLVSSASTLLCLHARHIYCEHETHDDEFHHVVIRMPTIPVGPYWPGSIKMHPNMPLKRFVVDQSIHDHDQFTHDHCLCLSFSCILRVQNKIYGHVHSRRVIAYESFASRLFGIEFCCFCEHKHMGTSEVRHLNYYHSSSYFFETFFFIYSLMFRCPEECSKQKFGN